jgi:DNA (cytosine-5)-methyltransferase 1
MREARTLVSLFSGAGGLDYGLEAAGFRTGAAVEMDHDCCETLRANRPWPVFEKSIFDVPTAELLEAAGRRRGDLDLVIGGPPCQPFSKAGYWAGGTTKRLDDPRAGTLDAYYRVIEEALPQAFIMENVEGLAYSKKDEGLAFVLNRIEEINKRARVRYVPSVGIIRAADVGVPQLRTRLFVVASREGTPFTFPKATHQPDGADGDLPRYRTAWDAIGDVVPGDDEDLAMHGTWADLLPSVPEGENYLWHTERGGGEALFGWRRRYWSFLLKLAKDRPSWTIQAQPGPATGPFHWDNRRLSMRELCRIQTFPDDVQITGRYSAVHKQLGNAVPSLLAEVIGRAVRQQLLGDRIARPLKLLPPVRSPTPESEGTQPVAEKYLALVGKHSPHPGTGKGNRASQWAAE